jgi:hypothetical protein
MQSTWKAQHDTPSIPTKRVQNRKHPDKTSAEHPATATVTSRDSQKCLITNEPLPSRGSPEQQIQDEDFFFNHFLSQT